jgi:hypothetical protein
MDIGKEFRVGSTRDYSMFKFLDTNRPANDRMVKKLIESIQEHGIQIPIIVNSEKYIVDGQHRFWALRNLKYEVPYIVTKTWRNDQQTIEINNTGKKWTAMDYANYATESGNLDVGEAMNIAAKWERETAKKLRPTTALEILMEGRTHSGLLTKLKNRTYKIDRVKGDQIYDTLNEMANHKMKASAFSARITRAIKVMNYDFDDLNEEVIAIMCTDNYIQNFNKENDQLEYLKDIYVEAEAKYNKLKKK